MCVNYEQFVEDMSVGDRILIDDGEIELGVVGKDYHPVQNVDAFRWFDFLLERKQATLEAGGSLREGQRVWVLAKMTCSAGEVVRGDRIDSYLLLSNSHSGDMRAGLALETAKVGRPYTETHRTGWLNSATLYLGGETPLGPVYLGYGQSDAGVSSVYLFIGTP